MLIASSRPLHEKIKAAIAAISPQPVRDLINTHYHGDHTGGDAAFAEEGAVVIAQVNVPKRLASGVTNALTGAVTAPVSGAALPTKTYADTTEVSLGGRTARLTHVANAHTDGDTYVYFADVAVGGNIAGMIAGTDACITLANDATKVVPGHGPLTNKSELIAYRANLVAARDRIAALIATGKSENDVVAAKPLADIDAKIGANATQGANFTRLVYRSLKP